MTPLQSFENSQALILLVFHSICSSVYEALFALSYSFLSESFSLCLIHREEIAFRELSSEKNSRTEMLPGKRSGIFTATYT